MNSHKLKKKITPLWQFWIDRGGTFTDCIGFSPDGQLRYVKVHSSNRAPLEGIRKILHLNENDPLPPFELKMGTTFATNALLERKGCDHALLITKGFKDILQIGTQQRPDLFDIRIKKPSVLYKMVVEVNERISHRGKVLQSPDLTILKQQLKQILDQNIKNIAIVFLHSYTYPRHEKLVASLARSLGFHDISCSHEVCPELGFTAKGDTTTADAYLTPLLTTYLQSLQKQLQAVSLKMMQSSGGLIDAGKFWGHNAILSGPAGGVLAYARQGKWFGYPRIIGFDMGGTSTDVSRFDGEDENQRFKAKELTVTDVNIFLGRLLQDNFPLQLYPQRVKAKIEEMEREYHRNNQNLSAFQIAEGFLEVINLKMAQAIKEISVAQGRDVREYILCCFGGAGGQNVCAVARHLVIKKILLHPLGGVLSAYGIGLSDTVLEISLPVARLPLNTSNLRKLQNKFKQLIQKGQRLINEQGFSSSRLQPEDGKHANYY
jgi:5-oxoprolinase (ATP-hydrolysing)